MVTLTFVFDKEKVAAAGMTEEALLAPMREHAAKYDIAEEEYGVFSKDGEDALCVISKFVPDKVDKNPGYLDLLEKWTLNVDGDDEDCIQISREWLRKHNRL